MGARLPCFRRAALRGREEARRRRLVFRKQRRRPPPRRAKGAEPARTLRHTRESGRMVRRRLRPPSRLGALRPLRRAGFQQRPARRPGRFLPRRRGRLRLQRPRLRPPDRQGIRHPPRRISLRRNGCDIFHAVIVSSRRKSARLTWRTPFSSSQRRPMSLRTTIFRNESPVSEKGISSL